MSIEVVDSSFRIYSPAFIKFCKSAFSFTLQFTLPEKKTPEGVTFGRHNVITDCWISR